MRMMHNRAIFMSVLLTLDSDRIDVEASLMQGRHRTSRDLVRLCQKLLSPIEAPCI